MDISREEVTDLVKIFYAPPFKTFFVNSTDGETFVKPIGVFVSLGITTSIETQEQIRDNLKRCDGGKYDAQLIILRSQKVSGTHMNSIVSYDPKEQYVSTKDPDTQYWSESEVQELLDHYHEGDPEYEKISYLLEKLNTEGWDNKEIYYHKGEYKIYHSNVNYVVIDNLDYRIGIYVTLK